jgi:hypothetical protein
LDAQADRIRVFLGATRNGVLAAEMLFGTDSFRK